MTPTKITQAALEAALPKNHEPGHAINCPAVYCAHELQAAIDTTHRLARDGPTAQMSTAGMVGLPKLVNIDSRGMRLILDALAHSIGYSVPYDTKYVAPAPRRVRRRNGPDT